jgi:TolA-binding protein
MLVSIIEYFIHCLFRFYVISLTCFYSLFGKKMKSITIILTLLLFFGCSTKKTDKELFDEAKKNLTDQNIPEAVSSFDELVNEYPESNLAPEALLELASIYSNNQEIPEAVLSYQKLIEEYPKHNLVPEAISELATIYQNKQVKNISEEENLNKSVELFIRLHDDYPSSEYAPSGLFMAGFIYANELQNFEAAKAIYQQFLNEYPEDELAASAKAELDFMGLSPEEILQKNMAREN